MRSFMVAVLAAALAGCQTTSGGSTPADWMRLANAQLVTACSYEATAEFLLSVFGKAELSTIVSQVCNAVDSTRTIGTRISARQFSVRGFTVAGVPFNPLTDGRFVR
ncbi:MAG TPA: hypothetical protein VFP43_09140 [Mesorhizobium sp.]|nr:hypothetical protein [Mesorhizobium sp.]